MIFSEKEIILNNGKTAILKSPVETDAEQLLDMIKRACGVVHPGTEGMHHARMLPAAVFRLVKAHQQQCQKSHVIAESQPGHGGGLLPESPTNAAINRSVTLSLVLVQLRITGRYKSKHTEPPTSPLYF